MVPVGVLWGYQSRSRLLSGGAGVLIEKHGELLQYL